VIKTTLPPATRTACIADSEGSFALRAGTRHRKPPVSSCLCLRSDRNIDPDAHKLKVRLRLWKTAAVREWPRS
jgi:hypothetical protein